MPRSCTQPPDDTTSASWAEKLFGGQLRCALPPAGPPDQRFALNPGKWGFAPIVRITVNIGG